MPLHFARSLPQARNVASDEIQNLPQQNLICVGSIYIGGVKEGDAPVESMLDDGNASFFTDRGIVRASETHAPKP